MPVFRSAHAVDLRIVLAIGLTTAILGGRYLVEWNSSRSSVANASTLLPVPSTGLERGPPLNSERMSRFLMYLSGSFSRLFISCLTTPFSSSV